MLQVAAGQRDALARLFDRYHKRLFQHFVRLGHARAASDDLVQDTFLRVLRLGSSYRGDGYFIGWLYRIARNVANDAWQDIACLDPLDDDMALLLPASPDHDPAAQHEIAALELRLQRALRQLPRESRELVLLSRVSELDSETLARLFDCTAGTVKVRLHRALLQLRHHFDTLSESVPAKEETAHD
jgi:RNA polymerase sigma factor (sigma-70 family)